MKLGIIACDILKPEIEFLTKDDPDFVVKEYLEFALHEYPQEMKAKIIETVNKYEGELDAVFLGYATCQSLDGVTKELKVPTVMLKGADCIDVLLTPQEYNAEKRTKAWEMKKGSLTSVFAEDIDANNVWGEYPRPQMVRKEWQSLNGVWELQPLFGNKSGMPASDAYSMEILVPFPIESPISGVMQHYDRFAYRRTFTVPASWKGSTTLKKA